MKKSFVWLLSLVFALSLGLACGPHSDNGDDDDDNDDDDNNPEFSLPSGDYLSSKAFIGQDTCSTVPIDPSGLNGQTSAVDSKDGTVSIAGYVELTRTVNDLSGAANTPIPVSETCTLILDVVISGAVVADGVMDLVTDQTLDGLGTCDPAELQLAQLPCSSEIGVTLTHQPGPA